MNAISVRRKSVFVLLLNIYYKDYSASKEPFQNANQDCNS